jgi:CheY-like chemotaxis protein/HPt (histidine-containing phosphotransfer) domain-containing protein
MAVSPAPGLSERLLGCRVLVVDDNPGACQILVDMIAGFQLHADSVPGAAEALAALHRYDREEPYDLVLADLGMPGMSGLELAEEIARAELARRPKVILITAFGREDVIMQAENAPLAAVLFKPVDQSLLHDTFVNVLARDSGFRSSVAPARALPRFDGRRVLLVEDNEVNQQIAREMMLATGLEVDIAGNGQVALDMLQAAGPAAYDLVLMDIQMPELGGHAATRRLRTDPEFAALPVLAMTAHATLEEREECARSGMQDHITKPIDPELFYQTLARWLPVAASAPVPAAAKAGSARPIEIPGFDTADTLDRLAGDVELYHQVLEMLLPSLDKALAQLDAKAGNNDRGGMKSVVHSIRGMAANIGARALSEAAAELESLLAGQHRHEAQFAAFRLLVQQTLRLVQAGLEQRTIGA